MHHLIGPAAGCGTCYYATEGLDNPDYEKFLEDHYREFGVLPPTTTVVSTRDLERTRRLLRKSRELGSYVDRFSVLSPAMRDTLFEAFTPEELLRVILLPQFAEAPGNRFVKAGRNLPEDGTSGGTIACTSGFIVNMQEQTVRLLTPCVSDRRHPTGEWILEKCAFTCAMDLETQIRRMISQYMPTEFSPGRVCRASCDFLLQEIDGRIFAFIAQRRQSLMPSFLLQADLDSLSAALKAGTLTGSQLLALLPGNSERIPGFMLLGMLWHHGLIDQSDRPE